MIYSQSSMPQVASLAYKPAGVEHRPNDQFSRLEVERVMLVAGHGIAGDEKGRSDSRQLNVFSAFFELTQDELAEKGGKMRR